MYNLDLKDIHIIKINIYLSADLNNENYMYVAPLSPKLEGSLASIEASRIKYIHLLDAAVLKDFFNEKIVQTLLDKQYTLVVVPEDLDTTIPGKILSRISLAHLCLPIHQGNLSERMLERIKVLKGLKDIPDTKQSLSLNLHNINETNTQLKRLLNEVYGRDLEELNILELIHKLNSCRREKPDTAVQMMMSHMIYDTDTLDKIDYLETIYNPKFRFIDAAAKLKSVVFEQLSNTLDARQEALDLKKRIETLLVSLQNLLSHRKEAIKTQIVLECQEWSQTARRIEQKVNEQEYTESPVSFEEACSHDILSKANPQYIKPNIKISKTHNWGQAKSIIVEIKKAVEHPLSIIDSEYVKFYQRLTPFNSNIEGLSQIVEAGMKVLSDINNSNYLEGHFPTRFFQISDFESKLRQADELCDLAQLAIADSDYCEYKIILKQYFINQSIIDYLVKNNQYSWRELTEAALISIRLEDQYPNELDQLDQLLAEYQEFIEGNKEIALTELHNRWCHTRHLATTALKNENWPLYQQLFEKQSSSIHFMELLDSAGDLLNSYFPVWVIKERELHLIEQMMDKFDEIILLDADSWTERHELTFATISTPITIATTHEFKSLPVNSLMLSSQEVRYDFITDFSKLNRTERYHQALSLASMLIDVIEKFSVYQYRNKCIISLLDNKINNYIQSNLENKGLNTMYPDSHEIADLVEAMIIENTEVIILSPDGLLNPRQLNNLEYQLFVLDQSRSAGIQIISLATTDLRKNYFDSLSSLSEKITDRSMVTKHLENTVDLKSVLREETELVPED